MIRAAAPTLAQAQDNLRQSSKGGQHYRRTLARVARPGYNRPGGPRLPHAYPGRGPLSGSNTTPNWITGPTTLDLRAQNRCHPRSQASGWRPPVLHRLWRSRHYTQVGFNDAEHQKCYRRVCERAEQSIASSRSRREGFCARRHRLLVSVPQQSWTTSRPLEPNRSGRQDLGQPSHLVVLHRRNETQDPSRLVYVPPMRAGGDFAPLRRRNNERGVSGV